METYIFDLLELGEIFKIDGSSDFISRNELHKVYDYRVGIDPYFRTDIEIEKLCTIINKIKEEYPDKSYQDYPGYILALYYIDYLNSISSKNNSFSNDVKKSHGIEIRPEQIKSLYTLLAPYFQGQESELYKLLSKEPITNKLNFNGRAIHLINTFGKIKNETQTDIILTSKTDLESWLCKNFQYIEKGAYMGISETTTRKIRKLKYENSDITISGLDSYLQNFINKSKQF